MRNKASCSGSSSPEQVQGVLTGGKGGRWAVSRAAWVGLEDIRMLQFLYCCLKRMKQRGDKTCSTDWENTFCTCRSVLSLLRNNCTEYVFNLSRLFVYSFRRRKEVTIFLSLDDQNNLFTLWGNVAPEKAIDTFWIPGKRLRMFRAASGDFPAMRCTICWLCAWVKWYRNVPVSFTAMVTCAWSVIAVLMIASCGLRVSVYPAPSADSSWLKSICNAARCRS